MRKTLLFLLVCLIGTSCGTQIQDSDINKFIYLNQSLEYHITFFQGRNDDLIEDFKKEAQKAEFPDKFRAAIKSLETLKYTSRNTLQLIENVKKDIVKKVGEGINPKTSTINKPKAIGRVTELMIGKHSAYRIEKELNHYVATINKEFASKFSQEFRPLTGTYDYEKGRVEGIDFAHYHFSNVSAVAAIAFLSYLQSEITRYDSECIYKTIRAKD